MMTQSELEDFMVVLVKLGDEADRLGFSSPGTFGAMGDLIADIAQIREHNLKAIATIGRGLLAMVPLGAMGYTEFLQLVRGVLRIANEADDLGLHYHRHFSDLGDVAREVAQVRNVSIAGVMKELHSDQN